MPTGSFEMLPLFSSLWPSGDGADGAVGQDGEERANGSNHPDRARLRPPLGSIGVGMRTVLLVALQVVLHSLGVELRAVVELDSIPQMEV